MSATAVAPGLLGRLTRGGSPGNAAGLLGLLAALVVLFTLLLPGRFATFGTVQSMMFQLPELGLLALAMVIPLISGGLNLAIIATTNQCALLMAWIMSTWLPAGAGGAGDGAGGGGGAPRRPRPVHGDRARSPAFWSRPWECIRSW